MSNRNPVNAARYTASVPSMDEYDRAMAGTSEIYAIAEDGRIVRRDAAPPPARGAGFMNGEGRWVR